MLAVLTTRRGQKFSRSSQGLISLQDALPNQRLRIWTMSQLLFQTVHGHMLLQVMLYALQAGCRRRVGQDVLCDAGLAAASQRQQGSLTLDKLITVRALCQRLLQPVLAHVLLQLLLSGLDAGRDPRRGQDVAFDQIRALRPLLEVLPQRVCSLVTRELGLLLLQGTVLAS